MNNTQIEKSGRALDFDARNEWLWKKMADRVAEGGFDVVILVARKMPRLAELFSLSFGEEVLVISDVAIPFCYEEIRGARVAIVDDMLNVGSTVDKISRDLRVCGAVAVEVFTLCRKKTSRVADKSTTVVTHELDDAEYANHVVKVPVLISRLSKPYDLAFPIIKGSYAAPYATASEIMGCLTDLYKGRLSTLPAPYHNSRAKRVSLIQPQSSTDGARVEHSKIRLYFDDETKSCLVVPMAIPPELNDQTLSVEHPLSLAIREHLTALLEKRCPDSNLREIGSLSIKLYVHALDWLLTDPFCQQLDQVLALNLADSFGGKDCEMIFGDALKSFSLDVHQLEARVATTRKTGQADSPSQESPFYKGVKAKLLPRACDKFKELCPVKIEEGFDSFSCVKAIIEALADLVGAEAPEQYELDFPYTREAVRKDPYLRLKVGPTFHDMILLVADLLKESGFKQQPCDSFYYALSVVLDMTVDNGSLVPTFARYGDRWFRVYRKGENMLWDKACHRVQWAVAQAAEEKNITFSVQRLSKLLSALSFSSSYGELLEPQVATRGFVASLPGSILDDTETAISYYMIRTGKLKPVHSDSSEP
ncbi:MAG: hypothetical protein IPK32_09565 [Verrucomicrobiaceae bacterium]|nr:hypothetical protein [Verrucomicrobiaceae bacterium]